MRENKETDGLTEALIEEFLRAVFAQAENRACAAGGADGEESLGPFADGEPGGDPVGPGGADDNAPVGPSGRGMLSGDAENRPGTAEDADGGERFSPFADGEPVGPGGTDDNTPGGPSGRGMLSEDAENRACAAGGADGVERLSPFADGEPGGEPGGPGGSDDNAPGGPSGRGVLSGDAENRASGLDGLVGLDGPAGLDEPSGGGILSGVETLRELSAIALGLTGGGGGKDGASVTSRLKALELLAKYHALFETKVAPEQSGPFEITITVVEQGERT